MRYLILFIAILVYFTSCKKGKAADPREGESSNCDTISFANDILPIMQNSCAFSGCHSTASAQDGVALSNYNEVNAVSSSRLIGSIKHTAGFDAMPQGGGKIPQGKIDTIQCWIDQGKLNN